MNDGVIRVRSQRARHLFALRNLVMALAHNARAEGKEALADELEAIEESLQESPRRNLQTRRSGNGV